MIGGGFKRDIKVFKNIQRVTYSKCNSKSFFVFRSPRSLANIFRPPPSPLPHRRSNARLLGQVVFSRSRKFLNSSVDKPDISSTSSTLSLRGRRLQRVEPPVAGGGPANPAPDVDPELGYLAGDLRPTSLHGR